MATPLAVGGNNSAIKLPEVGRHAASPIIQINGTNMKSTEKFLVFYSYIFTEINHVIDADYIPTAIPIRRSTNCQYCCEHPINSKQILKTKNPNAIKRWRPKELSRIRSEANPISNPVIVNTATHAGPANI